MINLEELIEKEISNGYSENTAKAKVCQDIILKAISNSPLSNNITVKGGVVMRSETNNFRRATQDLDLDFIKYSISDESIINFIKEINCLNDLDIIKIGNIEELKQQDYHGKRLYLRIEDKYGNSLETKIDLGVNDILDIKQEIHCFKISFDQEGAVLQINSSEQMFCEKLRSLLRFGSLSTRYKDIYDMYYLLNYLDTNELNSCLKLFIYNDQKMKENTKEDMVRRVEMTFNDKIYLRRLKNSDKRWLDEDTEIITNSILNFLKDS